MAIAAQVNRRTTISSAITSVTTSFTITSPVFDEFSDDYLTLAYTDSTAFEVIRCSVSGSTVTIIARGQDGTSVVDHGIGTVISWNLTKSHINNLIAQSTGGWTDAGETPTYSSDTVLTVTTGAKSKYGKGDKIKFNQLIPLDSSWSFDTGSADDMGLATMTNIGTPTYTAGKFGNALTLNGIDQALAITSAAVFKPTGAFTIGMWVKVTSDGDTKTIFQSYSDNTNANGILLNCAPTTNVLQFYVGNNAAAASSTLTGTTNLATSGGFHYVVVSSQGNHTKIFLDGVLEVSGYTVTPSYAATNYVRFGCGNYSGSNTDWFAGQIDDLFFINGFAVDEQWVKAKYDAATAQGVSDITVTQYMYVTGVADTTLTVNGGVDYVPLNAAISNFYYSKIENPLNFPQYMNWIPIVYNRTHGATIAATIKDCRFSLSGKKAHGTIELLAIADPVSGDRTAFYTTLPITAKTPFDTLHIGSGYGYDGSGSYTNMMRIDSTTSLTYHTLNNGTNGAQGNWGASNNQIINSFTYEIA